MKNLFKKYLIPLVLASFFTISSVAVRPALAVEPQLVDDAPTSPTAPSTTTPSQSSGGTSSSGMGDCTPFLGLTPWNCGVNITNEETLKSGIWTIAANIANDIAVIAAYLVLGYVIYGGYLYIFSQGDPNKVAAGKKTLVQAFIGLAIVMLANIILGTIRVILVGGSFADCTAAGNCASADPNALVTRLITWFISIAGIVSAIFLVYGGVSYITSSGDAGKLQKAKQVIIYSLIGLAIVALSSVITAFVASMIRDNTATSLINNSNIIAKE